MIVVSPSLLALRYVYDFSQPDRLLFGSDHPWVGIGTLLKLVEALDIPADHKAKLLGLNAAHLFKIDQ